MPKPVPHIARAGAWKPVYLLNCRTPAGIRRLTQFTKTEQGLLAQNLSKCGADLLRCIADSKKPPRNAQDAYKCVSTYIALLVQLEALDQAESAKLAAECLHCVLKFWGFKLLGGKKDFITAVVSHIQAGETPAARKRNALTIDVQQFKFAGRSKSDSFHRDAFKGVMAFARQYDFELMRVFEEAAK